MSDEEFVQCPNNPNHLVPRSQIDEHINKCKLLMDLNQEMQMTTSSDDEPRPSKSYQGSLQEGSSHQGGSQMATLPISEGTSTQEWRSPLKPGMQQRPYARPFQSSETSSETDVDLGGSECSSDNQSRLQMTDTRTKKYIKIISTRSKSLKKLTLDSHSDDTSSSSSDSTLSPHYTMSDKEKKIIQNLGEEYTKQTSPAPQEESSSQQATSSQQAASSPQETILQPAKLTLKKEDEKMEVKSRVSLSSSSLPQVSTSLAVPMEESSLSEDVSQEQSEPISSYAETTDDSDDTQRLKRKRKIKHKEMDTEETTEVRKSHFSTEVTTPFEVQMEESPLSEEDLQEQSQPSSSSAAPTHYSDDSQRPKIIDKRKHEKIIIEETKKPERSHTLSEVTSQLEVGLAGPSLSFPTEQSEPVSFPAKTIQESVGSERQSSSRKKKYEELMEMDPVRPEHPSMSRKRKYARMYTEENKDAKRSHLSTEETIPLEVQMEESSMSGDVPDIPVTHHDETIYDTSDDSSSDTDI